jgi:hypothetical protein
VLGLGLFGALGVSLAYLLVADLVGNHLLDSPALVALAGLTVGWIAISVVQEITAETFRAGLTGYCEPSKPLVPASASGDRASLK